MVTLKLEETGERTMPRPPTKDKQIEALQELVEKLYREIEQLKAKVLQYKDVP